MTLKTKSILFILLVGLQFLYFGKIIADREAILADDYPVRLKIRPLDPKSLLSGQYVYLTYEIGRFTNQDAQRLKYNRFPKKGETVYMELRESNKKAGDTKLWRAHRLHYRPGDVPEDGKFLKGKVVGTNPLHIKYGIEEFFVPQYDGKILERYLRDASVDIATNSEGTGGILKLYIKDKEYKPGIGNRDGKLKKPE